MDRSIDDENPRRNQRSWRSQMREQQLADNRRLLESVKRKMSNSPAPPDRTNISNQTNQNHRYNTRDDNKNYNWMPVHELAMNKHTKVCNGITRFLKLHH